MRATYLIHPIVFDLITLVMFGQVYKLLRSSPGSCHFLLLRSKQKDLLCSSEVTLKEYSLKHFLQRHEERLPR